MDIDLLISLIEAHPVLWDKISNIYKETKQIKHRKKCLLG